jgi:hypothetical protein
MPGNVAGMADEVKRPQGGRARVSGLNKARASSRCAASGIHASGRLIILRIGGAAFVGRPSPRHDHHRKNEQKRSSGHLAKHYRVSLIFRQDSRARRFGPAIVNFWLMQESPEEYAV